MAAPESPATQHTKLLPSVAKNIAGAALLSVTSALGVSSDPIENTQRALELFRERKATQEELGELRSHIFQLDFSDSRAIQLATSFKNDLLPDGKLDNPVFPGSETRESDTTEGKPGPTITEVPEKNPTIRNSIDAELLPRTVNMLKKMSGNARITYDRMVGRARDQDCNFIVADKPRGTFYLFNRFGQSIVQFPALFGRQAGDEIPRSAWGKDPDSLEEDEKMTPAGIFVLSSIYYDESLSEDMVSVDVDLDEDGSVDDSDGVALHALYLGNPGEKRKERIATETPKDNKISYGCMNVTEADFDEWIRPCFGAGGLIGVTPDNRSQIDTYIPPYTAEHQRLATTDKQ